MLAAQKEIKILLIEKRRSPRDFFKLTAKFWDLPGSSEMEKKTR